MTFEDICPAFRAYNALNRLPQNAPPFPFASNGYPIVQPGERYCRHPTGTDGILCGRVTRRVTDLHKHLAQFHGVDVTLRQISRKLGARTAEEIREDAKFYRGIMREEVYDDTEFTYEEVRRRVRERREGARAKRERNPRGRVVGQRRFEAGGAGEERARVVAEGDVLFEQVALGDDEGTPIDGSPVLEAAAEAKLAEERRAQEIVKRVNRRRYREPLPSNFGGGVDDEEEDEVMIVRVVERRGDEQRIPDASLVVDVEEVKSEEVLLEQHVERVEHEAAVHTSQTVSAEGMELKEEIQQKTPERQDEEDWGLAAAVKFLDSFEGYSGANNLTHLTHLIPLRQTDSALPEAYEDCGQLDADVEMPDVSIKKQSPETHAAQADMRSPTPPDAEDEMVYKSPYFSKTTHTAPEPKAEHITKKTPFDWSQFISNRVVAPAPKHEDEVVQEQDYFDSNDILDGSAEQEEADQEILELELAKSEYVLELATLKRKEAEAELGMLEVEQRLMEARGKRSRKG